MYCKGTVHQKDDKILRGSYVHKRVSMLFQPSSCLPCPSQVLFLHETVFIQFQTLPIQLLSASNKIQLLSIWFQASKMCLPSSFPSIYYQCNLQCLPSSIPTPVLVRPLPIQFIVYLVPSIAKKDLPSSSPQKCPPSSIYVSTYLVICLHQKQLNRKPYVSLRMAIDSIAVKIFPGCTRDIIAQNRQSENRYYCLLYTSPSPRDRQKSRMPSSA